MSRLDLQVPADPYFNVCPQAQWRKANFLSFYNLTSFANKPVGDWSTKDLVGYLAKVVLPSTAMSIAFAAIAVACFIGFIIWRISRCSAILCCRCCLPDSSHRHVLSSRWVFWLKVFSAVVFLGALITNIWALVDIPNTTNLVASGWQTAAQAITYVTQIIAALQLDLALLATTTAAMYGAASLASRIASQDLAALVEFSRTAANAVSALNQQAQPILSGLRESIINTYNSASDNWEEQTLYYWKVAVTIAIVVLAVCLGLLLIYGAVLIFNWGWGLGTMLVVEIIIAALFFLVAVALAFLMKGLYDTCGNMENVIVSGVDNTDLSTLMRYYLDSQSQPADATLFIDAYAFNSTEVNNTVRQVVKNANGSIARFLTSSDPRVPMYRPELNQALANLTNVEEALNQAFVNIVNFCATVQDPRNPHANCTESFLYQVQLRVVQYHYDATKVYLCCDVPGLAFKLWQFLTAMGWFITVLCLVGFIILAFIDKMPGSGACCWCGCPRPYVAWREQGRGVGDGGDGKGQGSGVEAYNPHYASYGGDGGAGVWVGDGAEAVPPGQIKASRYEGGSVKAVPV